MHDREQDGAVNLADVQTESDPAVFVLETVYHGSYHVVADGVAFPPPHEQVVVNWRTNGSVELLADVEALYEQFGQMPRVMWRHSERPGEQILTEAEPASVVRSR